MLEAQRICSPTARRATPTRKYRPKERSCSADPVGSKMELECFKKKRSQAAVIARELRKLVDPRFTPEISITRQCELLGLPRSRSTTGPHRCVNRRLRIHGQDRFACIWRIPAPAAGRMVGLPGQRKGIHDQPWDPCPKPMRRMGLRASLQKPRTQCQ